MKWLKITKGLILKGLSFVYKRITQHLKIYKGGVCPFELQGCYCMSIFAINVPALVFCCVIDVSVVETAALFGNSIIYAEALRGR